ncbi:MAG: sulfotransferase domain-containing protein [Anaerolineae bacterium]
MKTRPSTISDYQTRFNGLVTEHGRGVGLGFNLLPTDIVISPFNKSGTTWLQQIVHGLRTHGDMDFDDISRVVPWLELSTDLGVDIAAKQRGFPRAFKSHLPWHEVPKGGRYILPIRDPKDVLVSAFHFEEGWFFERGAFSLEEWADVSFLNPSEGHGYWHHLLSWWPQRKSENVFMLTFEQMKADLPETVRRVADFIDVELDQNLFDLVVHQASFKFMQTHKDRFDDYLMRTYTEIVGQLPPGSDASKVRSGKIGGHKENLTPALHQKLDDLWAQLVKPKLGYASYAALAQTLAFDAR